MRLEHWSFCILNSFFILISTFDISTLCPLSSPRSLDHEFVAQLPLPVDFRGAEPNRFADQFFSVGQNIGFRVATAGHVAQPGAFPLSARRRQLAPEADAAIAVVDEALVYEQVPFVVQFRGILDKDVAQPDLYAPIDAKSPGLFGLQFAIDPCFVRSGHGVVGQHQREGQVGVFAHGKMKRHAFGVDLPRGIHRQVDPPGNADSEGVF